MLNYSDNKGYTLVEVMIAVTIGLVLIAATSATYIVQSRSSIMQESVSETNTQSKIANDLMSAEIRSAGFGISVDLNEEPVNGYTTVITPVDNDSEPDAITVVGGFRLIGTLWPAGSGSSKITCPAVVEAGSTKVRIVYNGTDGPNDSDKKYLSIDGIETVQVADCTLGADGICESDDIELDRELTQDFPLLDSDGSSSCSAGGGSDCVTGRPVYLIEDTTFCVDSNMTLRRIRRNADPDNCTAPDTSDNHAIAENIEDLQIAYAVDVNNDGLMDDRNVDGDFDSDDFYIDADDIADFSTIMAFRINFLARSDRPDTSYEGLGNPPSTIENRTLASTDDDYRRRWWRTVVTLRNK